MNKNSTRVADSQRDQQFIQTARDLAAKGNSVDVDREPMHGALLVKGDRVISTGTSCRYSRSDPIRYAEMDCIANAGRRSDYSQLTLYTTGSPNWLSAGTMVQFGIAELVYAEAGDTEALQFLGAKGVEIREISSQ